MKPKVSESYLRGGVYAKITGKRVFDVCPHEEDDRYVLLGPNHRSVHRCYYEAVKEGIALASQASNDDRKDSSVSANN